MKIKDIMSATPSFVLETATLAEAAAKMTELDCGFLPVGTDTKLVGTVTDRDLATRGYAKGLAPTAKVSEVMTKKVLYCSEDDTTESIAQNMAMNQVRRLVVLNNKKDKRLVGVVALSDIVTSKNTSPSTAASLIKSVSLTTSAANKNKSAVA